MKIVDRLAYTVSGRSRARKFGQFMEKLTPREVETILDAGVNTTEYSDTDNYLEKFYPYPDRITAVGLEDGSGFVRLYPRVRYIQADATSLPFHDQEFDIAYANAVLEHVGDKQKQCAFLRELFRVARRGYLSTPNRHFPIELHTRIPLLHLLLPKSSFDAVARSLGKGWATGSYMNLLSYGELESLLNEAGITNYRILKNRFLGLPMTFSVIWTR